jgi:4-amino-4-deoxy-L-arabinose transferase-like glycosyltransferase
MIRPETAALLALGVVPFLGLGAFGVVDYDEAAYAEVARVMWQSGDWLVPRLCGETFFEKPPLLYWTQAAGFAVFGVGPFGARIGTALAGLAAPLALFAFARGPLGVRPAFLGGVALATSLELAALARVAFTDMLLLLWLTICLGALHRAFERPERGLGWFALASAAAALAILTKGAIGVLLPGAAALAHLVWWGRLREMLRPGWLLLGTPIVVGLGFSWYLLLGLTEPGGFAFMRDLFLEHHVGRFTAPMQGHSGSPVFYVPVLLVGFLPWSPFLPLALARARLRDSDERARFLRLFGLFSAITFVFFSVAATKLPNYLAPVLPGCALFVGELFGRERARDRAFAASLAAALAFALLLALVLALLPLVPARLPALLGERAAKLPGLAEPFAIGPFAPLAGALLAVGAGVAFAAFRGGHVERAFGALALSFAVTYALLFAGVLPRVEERFAGPVRRLAVDAAGMTAQDEPIVLLGLRHRPSVCFAADRPTEYVSPRGGRKTEAALFGGAPRVGITTEALLEKLRDPGRLQILERDLGHLLFRSGGAAARE